MKVSVCDDAQDERSAMPINERTAMYNAFEKLEILGGRLGSPHSSSVRGVPETLNEVRPRAGKSPWRAFNRRIGSEMVIGAIGPEALVNSSGFRQAARVALARLRKYEQEKVDYE